MKSLHSHAEYSTEYWVKGVSEIKLSPGSRNILEQKYSIPPRHRVLFPQVDGEGERVVFEAMYFVPPPTFFC